MATESSHTSIAVKRGGNPNKPDRYPDPVSRRAKQKRDSYNISNLTADKATRRVLAPYVRTVRRTQKAPTIQNKADRGLGFFLQKRPSTLFRNLSEFLLDNVDLPSLLHETADVLKNVTQSTGVVLYTVDASAGEIVQCPRHMPNPRHKVNWKIGSSGTVATYVAEVKEYILVEDVYQDRRFPEGVGWTGPMVRSVLCVPVVTPDDDCIAIIELFKTIRDDSYTKTDLLIVVAVTGWMGAAIHQNQQRIALQKQQELNDYLLDLTRCYFADIVLIDKIISEIVVFAKSTLGAERGSFYIIDRECEELVADLFDESLEPQDGSEILHKKKFKIRFSKDKGVAGLVARSGQTVNIKDAYNDIRFNREVDLLTGFITRSILCMPIQGRDGVLGVIQLINKRNGPCFTSADENIFKTFSVYCALALHYAQLQEQSHKVEIRNVIKTDMLTFHMQPCRHDLNRLTRIPLLEELPDGFNSFSWYLIGFEEYLGHLTLYMFHEMMSELFTDYRPWVEFILTVKKSYRPNQYHNFDHAFNVCHCMYNILKRNLDIFTPLEVRALLVSALCHDLDHRGYTNNFLQMTNHALSQLYPESPLENHHFQVTMLIMNSCNIFSSYSKQTYRELTQEIHDAIIATDLAFYFRCRSRLLTIMDASQFDWKEPSHRVLLKSIMMTTCDLSGQCKPFPTTKLITESLYREFYIQGDTEKIMGVCPLSMMDREKQHLVPEDQVQFITVVCLPCTQLLITLLPNTEALYLQCLELRNHWKQIIDTRGQKLWQPEDSIVIKDH